MKNIQVRNINLNLFPTLLKLLQLRNVTHAATELHLTQSTVSGSLKRLREIFDDELLISVGRDLILTEKSKELLPRLEKMLAAAEEVLGAQGFDPSISTTRFNITTADWISFLLTPLLAKHLNQEAPRVNIQFVPGDRSDAKDLRQGFADLLIGPDRVSDWTSLNLFNDGSDYCFEYVYTDRLVGIQSAHNLVPDIEVCQRTYLEHPHLTFNFGSHIHASVERDGLNAAHVEQNDRFFVPELTTLPYLVAKTGAVSVIPRSLARQMVEYLPIQMFDPPIDFPEIKLVMIWPKARMNDQSLTWLRSVIRQLFRDVMTEDEALGLQDLQRHAK